MAVRNQERIADGFMMTKQPVFPLADTPDVDLEQAGGTNVVGGETFATAERIHRCAIWANSRCNCG